MSRPHNPDAKQNNYGVCIECRKEAMRTRFKGKYYCYDCLITDIPTELQIYRESNLASAQEVDGGGGCAKFSDMKRRRANVKRKQMNSLGAIK